MRLPSRRSPVTRRPTTAPSGGTAVLAHPTLVFGPGGNVLMFALCSIPVWQSYRTPADEDRWRVGQRCCRIGHGHLATSRPRELAFADSTNIMIVDLATRKERPFVADNGVLGLAFSPNGLLLASIHDGGTLTLWNRASGLPITNNILAHPPVALDIAFSPDGRLLGTGGWDATAKLWDVLPGGLKLRHTLRGHMASVHLIFSPDGRRVLSSSSGDSTLKRSWTL